MAKSKLTERIQDEVAAIHRIRKGVKGSDNAAEQIRAIHELAKKLATKKT